jgi:hypothetical protein
VLFERTTMMWSVRPKALEGADPRGSVSLISNEPATMWSKMKIRRADGSEWRLWYHRIWRDDMQQVAEALSPTATPEAATG